MHYHLHCCTPTAIAAALLPLLLPHHCCCCPTTIAAAYLLSLLPHCHHCCPTAITAALLPSLLSHCHRCCPAAIIAAPPPLLLPRHHHYCPITITAALLLPPLPHRYHCCCPVTAVASATAIGHYRWSWSVVVGCDRLLVMELMLPTKLHLTFGRHPFLFLYHHLWAQGCCLFAPLRSCLSRLTPPCSTSSTSFAASGSSPGTGWCPTSLLPNGPTARLSTGSNSLPRRILILSGAPLSWPPPSPLPRLSG